MKIWVSYEKLRNIIDVEIEDNNFLAIKRLYPNATEEQIKKAISILEL